MKIIDKLAKENLLKNKKRTLVTIIATTLTSALLFSIGFGFSTYQKSEIKSIEKNHNGYDATLEAIPFSKEEILDNNKDIKYYEYISKIYDSDLLAYYTEGDVKEDHYLEIYTISDNFKINLKYGRLPSNENEIAVLSIVDVSLNGTLKINVTDLGGNSYLKEYKVVGVFNTDIFGFNVPALTKDNSKIYDISKTYFSVYLKNKKDAYNKLFSIAKSLDLEEEYEVGLGETYKNLRPNTSLLSLYGNFQNSTRQAIIYISLMIILSVLSVACVIIIYNSFAISVSDRKRDLGILKSVGMTNKQIRKLIFEEAFYISIISIPIGFIISYLFTGFVIKYINFIQNGIRIYYLGIDLKYLLICLIFIIITIIYSAFFPAMTASRITPLEAIRQNKDIKIKRNKKTLFSKIFGIHGFLASSNMKRNKSKYKITTIGSVISIILFITIATFVNYFQKDLSKINYGDGAFIRVKAPINDIFIDLKEITSLKIIDDYLISESKPALLVDNVDKYYTDDYKNQKFSTDKYYTVVLRLDKETYSSIKKEFNIKNDNPIFINERKIVNRDEQKIIKVFKDKITINTKICDQENEDNCTDNYELNIINKTPEKLKKFNFYGMLIVNDSIFDKFQINSNYDTFTYIDILSNDYIKLDETVKSFLQKTDYVYEFINNGIDFVETKNNFKCFEIVLYTLIVLFAFISITSIVNTISASMNLRKREFSILKSVGLDNKGFNKILILESLMLTIKTLIYSIIFSILVAFIIQNTFNLGNKKYTFMSIFPIKYFIISIIVVFVVITLTIFIQMKKLKKDNIIETIKKENI